MADTPPRDPELDAKMLAELRGWVANPRERGAIRAPIGFVSITDGELDLLLAIADERDEWVRQGERVLAALAAPEPLPADSWHDGNRPGPGPDTIIGCENAECSVSTFRMQVQGRCPSCNSLGFVIA